MILRDVRSGAEFQVPPAGARLGREPDLEVTFPESESVVSAVHARVHAREDGSWWLEDLGSTNGTWMDAQRIGAPVRLQTGSRFSLGQRGPVLEARVPGSVARTSAEKAIDPTQPVVRLRRVAGGADLVGSGSHVVLGRASACTIPLRTVADAVVSKHHAVVDFDEDGEASISDLGSSNGTFVNGRKVEGRAMLKPGDRVMLGWTGPLFEVRALGAMALPEGEGVPYHPERQPPTSLRGMIQIARERAGEARSGRMAVYFRALGRQMVSESSPLFRVVTLALLAVLAASVFGVYRVAARRASAAEERLSSAERALEMQLQTAGEAQRRSGEEIARLQSELSAARATSVSRSVLDSLERRLREAEIRAARSATSPGAPADFTRVARDNARAVGLVIVRFASGDSVMGSGFAISTGGVFVTNRHVVAGGGDRGAVRAIEVIMADTNVPLAADVVAVSNVDEQDLAVLRIRGYRGVAVRAIDWQGEGVQQGAPAALLGFPLGTRLALDGGGYVRTTMFAGIVSAVGDEWIRFGGSSFNGASGSPVFNSAGAVMAVHFGALSDGPGLGFSVPIGRVRRLLPADARAELGLTRPVAR